MKILATILFVFLAFAVKSQNKDLLEQLSIIKPLEHIQFSTKIDTPKVFSFQSETPVKYFLGANKNKSLNDLTARFIEMPIDNMPILNPGSAISKWNMAVAVPDSSVDYYIKNSLKITHPVLKNK